MALQTARRIGATVTAAGTLTAGQHTPVDATGGNLTVTLPTGVTAGAHLSVEKRDTTGNTVTVSGSIRGATATVALSWQYETITLRYDGATWTPTEGHKTRAALDATYVPKSALPNVQRLARGNRVVALGDSLTQWQDNNPVYWRRVSWFPFATVMSGGQINYAYNAGIGGNTTAQMIARFTTDVTAHTPATVVILGGRNDPDAATTITNLQTLVGLVQGIGALPVLCTLPPCNDSTTHVPDNTRNAWIRRYAAANGIPLIDFRSALVDPTNGNYQAAYYNDGTHPNDAGFAVMAQAAVTALSPVLPPYQPHLTSDNTDATNIIGMGALTGTVSALDAGPWNIPVSSGTRTTSQVTDSSIQGNWVRLVDTGATGTTYITQDLTPASLIAGHTYALSGRVKYSGTSTLEVKIYIGGTEYRAISDWTATISNGIYYLEFPVAANNAAWEYDIVLGAGSFDVSFAQPTLYDLTALGLA